MWAIEKKRSVVKCRQWGAIFTLRCHVYILAFSIHTNPSMRTLTHTHIIFFNTSYSTLIQLHAHQTYTCHYLFVILCAMSVFLHAVPGLLIMFVMCLSVTIRFETLQSSLEENQRFNHLFFFKKQTKNKHITICHNTFYDLRVAVLDLPQWLCKIRALAVQMKL